MECRRDRKARKAELRFGEPFLCFFDRVRGAAEDDLLRMIVVRDDDREIPALHHIPKRIDIGRDRRHRAGLLRGFGHEQAAGSCDA